MKVNIILTDDEKALFKSLKKLNCSHVDCTICPFYLPALKLPTTPNGGSTQCLVSAINERSDKLL